MKEINFTYGRFKIEEVVVLNLAHRFDKKWAMIGALLAVGCPLDRIRLWNAAPGNAFEDIDPLLDYVVADGFPWFETFAKKRYSDLKRPETLIREIKILAQAWSYCQMLRHLSENNINGIILYDDRYILDFEQLSAILYWLRDFSDKDEGLPFRMLQCDSYENVSQHLGWTPKLHSKLPYILEGPAGGSENAIFYTPEGAKFFLDYLKKSLSTKEFNFACPSWNEPGNIEGALSAMSHLPASERLGVWTAYNCQLVHHVQGFGSDIGVGEPQYENKVGSIIKTGGWEEYK